MKSLVRVSSLFCCMCLMACGTGGVAQAEKLMRQGAQCVTEQNWEQAVTVYEEAMSLDGENANVYIGLANAYVTKAENGMLEAGISMAEGEETKDIEVKDIEAKDIEAIEEAIADYKAAIGVLEYGKEKAESTEIRDLIRKLETQLAQLEEKRITAVEIYEREVEVVEDWTVELQEIEDTEETAEEVTEEVTEEGEDSEGETTVEESSEDESSEEEN